MTESKIEQKTEVKPEAKGAKRVQADTSVVMIENTTKRAIGLGRPASNDPKRGIVPSVTVLVPGLNRVSAELWSSIGSSKSVERMIENEKLKIHGPLKFKAMSSREAKAFVAQVNDLEFLEQLLKAEGDGRPLVMEALEAKIELLTAKPKAPVAK